MDDQTKSIPARNSPETANETRVADEVTRAIAGNGRVCARNLEVSTSGETVRLRGRVNSYYQKQVAQVAALRVIGSRQLVNELEVP